MEIAVDDDGTGVPEEERTTVFGRFARGSTASRSGSGLGLALVAQQAELHGGTARLDKSPLGGARLLLSIPATEPWDGPRKCRLRVGGGASCRTRGAAAVASRPMDGNAPTGGHVVLAEADGGAYRSLRQRPVTRAERHALGKSLRKRVPRKSLADWTVPSDRPDPVDLVNVSHQGRVDRLVPIRVGRMIESPYGFLRGTAVVMAEDVAGLPSTGITPVVCGDAHLGNFGFYASPELDLVIDLNDFDEAHPGGWGVGPSPVGGEHLGRRAPQRGLGGPLRRGPCDRASQPIASNCDGLPSCRCSPGPSSAWTSTGWPRRPPVRCSSRSPAQPSGPATAPVTERCRGSPTRSTGCAESSRSRR